MKNRKIIACITILFFVFLFLLILPAKAKIPESSESSDGSLKQNTHLVTEPSFNNVSKDEKPYQKMENPVVQDVNNVPVKFSKTYHLGDTITEDSIVFSDEAGSWTDWNDCETIRGENSAIRNIAVWEEKCGQYSRMTTSCRTIQSDGTFESGAYTIDDVFKLSDEGDRYSVMTDLDFLPVGILPVTEKDKMYQLSILGMKAEDIYARKDVVDEDGSRDSYDYVKYFEVDVEDSSCGWGVILDEDAVTSRTPLACPEGSVLTGLMVYKGGGDDSNSLIYKWGIRCRNLEYD